MELDQWVRDEEAEDFSVVGLDVEGLLALKDSVYVLLAARKCLIHQHNRVIRSPVQSAVPK
jgi:hypothetical protein